MLVTTSRKPSVLTKRFGRLLAKLLPFGLYENRGKMNVAEVAARAYTLGKSRACIVHEMKGNPVSLVFMTAGDSWQWLSPELYISKIKIAKESPAHPCESISIEGKMKREMENLVLPKSREIEDEEAEVKLQADEEMISFTIDGKEILSMNVRYHERRAVEDES